MSKKSIAKRVLRGIQIPGANLGITAYHKIKAKTGRMKMIDKVARQKVKQNIVGGESAEQLQEAFIKKRRKLIKKMKKKKVY